ncbi:O-antigen ligase family protein [Myroides odoratimimus]|uniref:O-antigen ligase family protein n=1 Tax=Myroides odoratimimus TaxID=76832 RepID=UPI002575A854|nr:O-antigen ligase family protein [Myroides odoratimimus]MDM1415684.1 O-antigen ligase family protein [Myroides odoratimimus]
MELIFTLFFVFLFLIAILKRKTFVWIFPIFVLCYPHNSNMLNFGGVGLDKFLVLFGFFIFRKNNNISLTHKKWMTLLFCIWFLDVFSNLVGYFIDDFENFRYEIYLKGLLLSIFNLCIVFLYIRIIRNKEVENVVNSLILACTVQALFGVLLYYNHNMFSFLYNSSEHLISGETTLRAVGTTKGPWELGGLLAFGYVLVLFCLVKYRLGLKGRLIYISSFIIILLALILSMSRAGWLFVFVSTLVLFVYNIKKMTGFLLILFLFSAVFLVSYLESFIDLINHRVLYTFKFNSGRLDNSSQTRLDLWEYFLSKFEWAYIFFGYGWQNLIAKFGTSTHNSFLSLFLSTGLFGLVLYFKYFKILFIEYFKYNIKEVLPYSILIVGFFFYSLTTDAFFTQSVMYMLNFLGCIIVNYTYKNQRE